MSMYTNLFSLYDGGQIGPVDIMIAADKGWLTQEECARMLMTNYAYPLDKAKIFKKRELSYRCNKAIAAGIDVRLSDGEYHHFSLTDHDQTNLNAKMSNILAGVQELEYHSDGDPCMYYSAEDMMLICVAAQQKVTFETTYYNCMVQWVKDCKLGEQVAAINYGDEVPEKYWSEPWRTLLETAKQMEEQAANAGVAPAAEQAEEVMTTEPAVEPTKPKMRKKKATT